MPRPAHALRGCIPIVCTPFHDDGALDLDGLQREVDWLIAEGAAGVAALAIASEGYKLTEPERDAVARATVEAAGGRVPVVLSADGAGTAVAVDRARRCAAVGADALMVLPPYFVKPDQSALLDYYRRVGQAVEVPVIIQDAPQLTGVAMGPALWARLAAEVDTICYVKAEGVPQGTTLSETIRQSEGRLAVFCGWGGLGMLDAMERGAVGSMPAPAVTRLFADVQRLWEAGDRQAAADRFHAELPFVLWTIQSIDFSVHSAKEELRRRGLIASAHVRQPAVALDAVAQAQLARWLDARLAGTPAPVAMEGGAAG
jgi:2-keto-3-deoxy-L-arabinonate dehydratase